MTDLNITWMMTERTDADMSLIEVMKSHPGTPKRPFSTTVLRGKNLTVDVDLTQLSSQQTNVNYACIVFCIIYFALYILACSKVVSHQNGNVRQEHYIAMYQNVLLRGRE